MNPKKLTRSRDDRWLGGVCGGLAEYTGIDAWIVRLITVVAIVLGAGSLILVYLICWIFIPRASDAHLQPATPPVPPPPSSSSH
ncbi:MAG TPA: PspC domain-containing protein [Aeromicrobium sp.]|nr:PspC domain-containing protein [Aeromicrobium sp.]